MKRKRLPRSQRKFIRQEKARIRREVLELKKQDELINELYQKFFETVNKAEEKIEKKTG